MRKSDLFFAKRVFFSEMRNTSGLLLGDLRSGVLAKSLMVIWTDLLSADQWVVSILCGFLSCSFDP